MTGVSKSKLRLGVMGGSFDPIHYGHLFTAEAARVEFDLSQVVFMPAAQSPAKERAGEAGAQDRYTMAVLATVTNPYFSVSRFEIEKPGPSYTIDTLRHLYNQHGGDVELFFITGADAVLEILEWKEPESLSGFCEFIAASRPGYELGPFQELLKSRPDLPRVQVMEIPALAISSTDLRARVKQGLPIIYLVPDTVAGYIAKAGLYK